MSDIDPMTVDKPLEVTNTVIPSALAAVLRYALTALGAMLLAKGVLPEGTDVNELVAFLLVIVSSGYGIWKAISNKRKLIVTADAAPNSVAVVK